jgi:HEAT repeat protein
VLISMDVREKDKPEVVKALAKRISPVSEPQAIVRFHAALAIGQFGEQAAEAIPILITSTKDAGSFEIRKAAVGSLARVGMDSKKGANPLATKALIDALGDHSAEVRIEATMGLGAMGAPASELRPNVIAALRARAKDTDKPVIIWSHVALMAIEKVNDKDLGVVAKFLASGEPVKARTNACRALGVLGVDARPKIDDLIAVTRDKEPLVAGMACWALGEIGLKTDPGAKAKDRLTAITQQKDADVGVKGFALEALEKIKTGIAKEKEKDKPKDTKLPGPGKP